MITEAQRLMGKVPGQFITGTGQRLTLVATDAATAEAALPTDSKLLVCRALGPIMIRFGMAGMAAPDVDDDSILFPPGEAPIAVPKIAGAYCTHVRIIRADIETGDYNVQFEKIATVG